MKDKHEERQLSLHFEAPSGECGLPKSRISLALMDIQRPTAEVVDLSAHRVRPIPSASLSDDDRVQSLLSKALARVRLF